MTERKALLAAIRANPDADLPRLVFADWLDENGESERATVIREELSGLPDCPRTQFWGGLSTPLFPLVQDANYITDRGFLSSVSLSFASWLTHADAILPESVGLTVRLTGRPALGYTSTGKLRLATGTAFYTAPYCISGSSPPSETDMLRHWWPEVAAWELPPDPP